MEITHYSYKKVVETESSGFSILIGVTRMRKKSSGLPFMPLLHNAFLALFGAPGSGSRQLLTLIFQKTSLEQ
jgi:hypothetical protein